MSLSAREQRLLAGIDHQLSAEEPRLAHALGPGGWPGRRRARWAPPDRRDGVHWMRRPVLAAATLLAGVGLLTVGLIAGSITLICLGALLAQFGPVLIAGLGAK
jgi:hypothetical protein